MKEINRLKEKREEKQRAIDSYKGMREKVEIISPYLFLNRSTMNQQVRIEKGNAVLNLSICSIKIYSPLSTLQLDFCTKPALIITYLPSAN